MSEANRCPACGSCVPLAERAAPGAAGSDWMKREIEDGVAPGTYAPDADPCDICGKDSARQWLADNALWDMLATNKTQVCSDCFDNLAKQKGIILFWSARISKHSLEEHPALAAAQPGEPAPSDSERARAWIRSFQIDGMFIYQRDVDSLVAEFVAIRREAREAALEQAAQHFASDHNGKGWDWVCSCGVKGHWGDDSWAKHIRALKSSEREKK